MSNPTSNLLSDRDIEARIKQLRRSLAAWLKKHDIDHDVFFKSYVEHFDDLPGINALVMCITSAVDDALNSDLQTEFCEMVESFGFWYEFETASAISFFPSSDEEVEQFRSYLNFHYYQDLLAPDFADVYSEIFGYFGTHHDRLERLTWRSFEELVASIFKNQGYRTELGRGWADEGVDIRLLEHSVHGEISTLVQVKKYRKDRPIRLEAIAALSGHIYDRSANRGIFVTTSRFLPGARRFAARQDRSIVLADSGDLAAWCTQISDRLGNEALVPEFQQVIAASQQATGAGLPSPVGQIVCASVGVNCIMNQFAIVLRATPRAALLAKLPSFHMPYKDPRFARLYPQFGEELPDLASLNPPLKLIRAKRNGHNESFWGDKHLYSPWNGKPVHFDWND